MKRFKYLAFLLWMKVIDLGPVRMTIMTRSPMKNTLPELPL